MFDIVSHRGRAKQYPQLRAVGSTGEKLINLFYKLICFVLHISLSLWGNQLETFKSFKDGRKN
jgi:hypothetical protein